MEPVLTESRNLSERVYDLIRRDIMQGILMPEDKLRIDAVSERYQIGLVPVREALNRLSAEGLVVRKKQRGFFVSPLALDDLENLVKTRIWAEKKALGDSIAAGDDAWEDELILSFHRLVRFSRKLKHGSERDISEEWDIRHKDYHMLLIGQCGSVWLIEFCSQMMDQAVRYRNISMNINQSEARREGGAEEHNGILESVLARDGALACQLLEKHYLATLAALRPT
jgi:DNA-binding GntR family transcriptional regulator